MERILEDDVIMDIMWWPSFFANNKTSRIITTFFFIFMILEGIFCIPLLVYQYTESVAQYSPFIVGTTIAFVSYTSLYIKHKAFCNMYNEIFPTLWPLKSTGQKIFEYIRNIGTKTKYFTVFLTLLTVISATLALPWFGDEYDLYVTIKVFNDCLDKKYAIIFSTVFYISLYHGGFTIVLNVLTFMYLVLHVFFQCILLKNEFEKFGNLSEFHNQDDFHQNIVKKKLKLYIKHHQKLWNFMVQINNFMYFPILCFTFCGIVCGVSLIFVPKILERNFWRVLFTGLVALTLVIAFCFLGQLLEDTAEEIYSSVGNLKWYEWNTKNKKLILMLLGKSHHSMVLSSSGLITVNYQLLIALYQKIYSGITFLINMSHNG